MKIRELQDASGCKITVRLRQVKETVLLVQCETVFMLPTPISSHDTLLLFYQIAIQASKTNATVGPTTPQRKIIRPFCLHHSRKINYHKFDQHQIRNMCTVEYLIHALARPVRPWHSFLGYSAPNSVVFR